MMAAIVAAAGDALTHPHRGAITLRGLASQTGPTAAPSMCSVAEGGAAACVRTEAGRSP
jgi:hypothetical protein